MGASIVWVLLICLALIFVCNSLESLWNPAVQGQYIEYGKLQPASFSTELALDTIILCSNSNGAQVALIPKAEETNLNDFPALVACESSSDGFPPGLCNGTFQW